MVPFSGLHFGFGFWFLRGGTLLFVVSGLRGRLQAHVDRVVVLSQHLVDTAQYVVHEPVILGDVRGRQGHRVADHRT